MSRRIISAAAIGCALAGCQTATPVVTASPSLTRADSAVARASAELARHCGLTRTALAAIGFLAPPKAVVAASYASAVDTVCAAPPSDVPTALATIGRAYQAVVAASAE